MNSPYMGKFRVSQQYKPGTHDGLDLVGIDSKEIHATVSGTVRYAGWENPNATTQGFGQYVCIKGTDGLFYYYGHMSQLKVSTGQAVKCTDIIGIEGSTGHSTGSHCHYEIRGAFYKGAKVYDVCEHSGIPNVLCGIYDDEYAGGSGTAHTWSGKVDAEIVSLQEVLRCKGEDIVKDGIAGEQTLAACKRYTIELGDKGDLTRWVQLRLGIAADGIAGPKTMTAIADFQRKNGLGEGYLGGEDWYYLIK